MIRKLFISLVVANAAAFITVTVSDAAPFQLQPKSLAEVQLDQSDGELELILNLVKTILPAARKSIETGEPPKDEEIVLPIVKTFGNFLSLLENSGIGPDPHGAGALFLKN